MWNFFWMKINVDYFKGKASDGCGDRENVTRRDNAVG